jgi:hypothetical protein
MGSDSISGFSDDCGGLASKMESDPISRQAGGLRFVVSGRRGGIAFLSFGLSGPKTTRALGGRLRMAVVQSVGAGWRAAGTLSTQIRHIPLGGM